LNCIARSGCYCFLRGARRGHLYSHCGARRGRGQPRRAPKGLRLSWFHDSSNRPTVPTNGSSVHLTPLFSLLRLWLSSGATGRWTVDSSDGACLTWSSRNVPNHLMLTPTPLLCTVGSSDSALFFPFLSRFRPKIYALFFPFLSRFRPKIYAIFSFWHVVFLHPWDLEMSTKTC
jgi:hypothetical protein